MAEAATLAAKLEQTVERFCGGDNGRALHLRVVAPAGGIEFGRRQEQLKPAASVAKLAVVMAVLDEIEAGRLDPGHSVAAAALGGTRYCSVLKAFDHNHSFNPVELCRLALITSDNPATTALLSYVSKALVQQTLRAAARCPEATFGVGFADDELSFNRRNVLSARGATDLLQAIWDEPRYEPLRIGLENNLRNMRIPRLLSDDARVLHKTGTLNGVVNDCGIVIDGEVSFILSMLADEQADALQTEIDMAVCARDVMEALKS
jgi:beta-lactamase class A